MHAYMNTKHIQPCTHTHTCISQCSRHLAKANINARPFQGLSCPSRRLLALLTRLLAPSSLRCLSARFFFFNFFYLYRTYSLAGTIKFEMPFSEGLRVCVYYLHAQTDTHAHTHVQTYTGTHIDMCIKLVVKSKKKKTQVSLSKVFEIMTAQRAHLGIRDWGVCSKSISYH
jgi:hypothetical protein